MASETGKPIQVVVANQDQTGFSLNEDALRSLLERPDVSEKNVVVVSVAGAFRLGKSFLLSFMPRFISALDSLKPEEIRRGDWLGNDSQALSGFHWCGGHNRDTTGIWFWNEPFFQKLLTGEEVAILLMDSQGTFDNQTTPTDCATVFALSTLISSVQVYNLSTRIQENDLQNLQLFTQYGLVAKEDESELYLKPFQRLVFLVRDWTAVYKEYDGYPHGAEGGKAYLNKILKPSDDQHPALRQLREEIGSSFESTECFLMPPPGEIFEIQSPHFDGRASSLTARFKTHLTELLTSILSPENLIAKEISGRKISAKQLLGCIKGYVEICQGDKAPQVGTIFMATVGMNYNNALDAARKYYKESMDQIFGSDLPYMEPHQFRCIHSDIEEQAVDQFRLYPKLGGKKISDSYLLKLMTDIKYDFDHFERQNDGKISIFLAATENIIQQAVDAAIMFYTENIDKTCGKDAPYLQSEDLENKRIQIHGLALDRFEEMVISLSREEQSDYLQKIREDKKGFSLNKLEDSMQKVFLNYKYANASKKEIFSSTTDANNHLASAAASTFFMNEMENTCGYDKPYLPPDEFTSNGRKIHKLAVDMFENYPKGTVDERSEYLRSMGKDTEKAFLLTLEERLEQDYALFERQNERKKTEYLVSTEANMKEAVLAAKTFFREKMEQTCGKDIHCLPSDCLENSCRSIHGAAVKKFYEILQQAGEEPSNFLKKLGEEKETFFLNKLEDDLQHVHQSFKSANENKKAIFLVTLEKKIALGMDAAKTYYSKTMNQAVKDVKLWLSTEQLQAKDLETATQAMNIFEKDTAVDEKTDGIFLKSLAVEQVTLHIDPLQNELKALFELFKDQNDKNYNSSIMTAGIAVATVAATVYLGGAPVLAAGATGSGLPVLIAKGFLQGLADAAGHSVGNAMGPPKIQQRPRKGENVRSILEKATTSESESESDSDDGCHKLDPDI